MPNQPATPLRSVRIPDDLWQLALEVAEKNGETVSDVIRRALVEYVTTDSKSAPTSPQQPRRPDAQ